MADAVASLRAELAELHQELPRNGLVAWTSGNISARVPGEDAMVIKASGVAFDDLTSDAMLVCDLSGRVVRGELAPSSDTLTHAHIYRELPHIGGIAHTHSPYATAWAARGEEIPCVLTAMADEFGGPIPVGPFALIGGGETPGGLTAMADEFGGPLPVGPFALIGGEEIGRAVVATLSSHRSPAVL